MLDTRSFVLLAICIKYIATEYTISSDGWIPLTSDQVYNPTNRNWIRNDLNIPYKSQIITSNTIKITNAQDKQEKDNQNYEDIETVGNPIPYFSTEVKMNDQKLYKNDDNMDIVAKFPRQAKEINEQYSEKSIHFADDQIINHIKINNDIFKNLKPGKKIIDISQRSNKYEVEEDVDDFQKEEIDYFKEADSPPASINQTFVSTLFNILSKYNININDRLKNYDLSRQIKYQLDSPNSLRVIGPYRYNNLNHLPMDPLLAVFLSNYGFYIPSLYGMKSNYNNLYGYLASNNIHNNRPFGMYKIFSDTDSWN